MEFFPESKDRLPLTWWKQTPLYLAALLALAGVASMVMTAVLSAISPALVQMLMFDPAAVLTRGWLWQPVTYVLVNPVSIWFLLTSYMLWSFGEAVERHLGRWSFVKLLLLLLFVTPALLCLLFLAKVGQWPLAGLGGIEFGVFIAFATLYPRARISLLIIELEVWVLATAIVAISALGSLSVRDWPGLFMLACQVGIAVAYIRYEQGRLQWPSSLNLWPKPRPNLTEVPRRAAAPKAAAPVAKKTDDLESVDNILEKISRTGLASLTDEERRILEKASEHLGRRNPKR